jgi:hypothetical protein
MTSSKEYEHQVFMIAQALLQSNNAGDIYTLASSAVKITNLIKEEIHKNTPQAEDELATLHNKLNSLWRITDKEFD